MCGPIDSSRGYIRRTLEVVYLHFLLLIRVFAPSADKYTKGIYRKGECPFMALFFNLLHVCPMRRFFSFFSTPGNSKPDSKSNIHGRRPESTRMAVLCRASHLLQLHFVVFWGFFVSTSHAFVSSYSGVVGPLTAPLPHDGPRSPLMSGMHEHPRAGHRLSNIRFRPSSVAASMSSSNSIESHHPSASHQYMNLNPLKSNAHKKSKKRNSKLKHQPSTSSIALEQALRMKERDNSRRLPEVLVIGVSHRHAPVEVREQLAIQEEDWNSASSSLCESESIDEAFILSTCNRFEVYVTGKNEYEAMTGALEFLQKRTNGTLDEDLLRRHMFVLTGQDAVFHLMRVSAGLDSMVLGEAQIQCQVKKAYHKSCLEDGGKAGLVLKQVLEAALTAGKRVRSETEICKGAVSVSSAAVEFTALKMQQLADAKQIQHSLRYDEQGAEETVLPAKSLTNSNIVILGAGKMSRLLLVHLNSKKVRKVTVVNRSADRVSKLQEEFKDLKLEYMPLDKMWKAIQAADVVYPCTSSVTPLINLEELQRCMVAREKSTQTEFIDAEEGLMMASPGSGFDGCGCPLKEQASKSDIGASEGPGSQSTDSPLHFTPRLPLRFIDLSVPRNVHPSCNSVTGVECYNVDDLQEVVHLNTARRQGEIGRAEGIIREEIKLLQSRQESLGALPTMNRLQEKAEEMRLRELEKSKKDLMKLSPEDLRTVDRLSRGIVGKLLRGPMEHLRNTNKNNIHADETAVAITQVQKAFHSMLKS